MDLSVVIVSYNVKSFLEQALRTITDASQGLEVEIFTVDNNSADGSPKMVESQFPDVRLICNDRNVGFAKANNQVIQLCKGRHILLINADTIVQRDTLRTMVKFMDEHKDAGAAGCKLLNPDGTLQLSCRRGFPSPDVAFYKIVGLSNLFPKSRRFGRYNLTYLDPSKTHEVDALSGSFMIVRREILDQVGLLDDRWFFYAEDLDWCYRIKQAGWKVYYVPETEIIHFKGESSKKVPRVKDRITFYRAMYIFVQKHFKKRLLFIPLEWFLTVGIILRGLISILVRAGEKFLWPVIDSALVLLGLYLGITLRFQDSIKPPAFSQWEWTAIYALCWASWLLSFWILGLYDRNKYSPFRALLGVLTGYLPIAITGFSFREYHFSRIAMFYAWAINCAFIAGWRTLFYLISKALIGRDIGRRRSLIVGAAEEGASFMRMLNEQQLDYEVVGFVDSREEMRGNLVEGKGVIGVIDDLPALVREYRVDEIIVTTKDVPYSDLLGLNPRLFGPALQLKLVPGSFDSLMNGRNIGHIDDLPLVEIAYRRKGILNRIFRRDL